MADAVSTNVIADTPLNYVVHFTNISDGTGEVKVKKINIATIGPAVGGAQPAALNLEQIRWSIQGFASVQTYWDHTTDDVMQLMAGNGYEDYKGRPGDVEYYIDTSGLPDPRSAGADGSILLSAPAGATTGTYDITMWFKKIAA